MKNRNKWITIIFLSFILLIPSVTIIREIIPGQLDSTEDVEAQQEILKQNGTLQEENTDNAEQSQQDLVEETVKLPLFQQLQNTINNFTESLFLRTDMISFNTNLASLISQGTYIESTQVMAGKEGWLFYKSESDGNPVWDYMGINHFTDDELAEIAGNLVRTRDYFASQGIEFMATCIPNKEIIYEEYMPDTIVRVNNVSRGEQMSEYITANTDLVYAYPKQALLEAKNQDLIYYKTDTHWNQIGAFIGVQELFEKAYGVKDTLDSVSFTFKPESYSGDLAYIAGITDKYPLNDVYSFDEDTAQKSMYQDKVAVVVGDSFGGFWSTIAKGYYSEVHWMQIREFDMEEFKAYNPDVVIWETVERYCEVFANPTLIE